MELTTFYYIFAAVYFGIVGLCVGSFLNVVIYRLPNKMSLVKPASHCTNCDYQLKWYDNIPVVSYIVLGGKCRKCKSKISPRYITVEILNMCLWLLCFFTFGFGDWREIVMSVTSAIACSVCVCIAAIDFEHKIIFDRFQIMMVCLAIPFMIADRSTSVLINIITAFAACLVLFLIAFAVINAVNEDAVGGGDIKFAFGSALFLGWKRVILMWILASVSSLIYIAASNIKAKKRNAEDEQNREYPFGPFLVFGFIAALLFGRKILSLYLGLFGL